MKFTIKNVTAEKEHSHCVVIGIFEKGALTLAAQKIDQASNGVIKNVISQGDCNGKLGQLLLLRNVPNCNGDRILLVGCGDKEKLNENNYIKIVNATFQWLKARQYQNVALYLTDLLLPQRDIAWLVRTTILCAHDSFYCFDQLKQKKADKPTLSDITLFAATAQEITLSETAVNEANAIACGVSLAKNLGNLPANICTPTYLANKALELAKQYSNLTTKVLEEKSATKKREWALCFRFLKAAKNPLN